MKNRRVKVAVVSQKGKKKRWKKGHSSDSNPEAKKHRLAAKNRFFNRDEGGTGLTEAALAKHNEAHKDAEGDDMMSSTPGIETGSVTANTFNTWATSYTDCTNATFSKVHRYWHSNSAQHKEILAVLAAVTEVIKTQGGKETETEYFGALMTALETMEGEETLSAVAYLLSLAIKRVPLAVLKSKFSDVAKCLVEFLGKYVNTNATSLLRSVIICLASVLRVQDQSVWSSASTLQVYHALLAFITYAKPKVRKAAQEAVRVVLKGSQFMTTENAPPYHPAASATAKYCIQQIEQCGGVGEATATLHTLELLKNILSVLPQHSLKSCCEMILRVMTLSNVLITSVSMRCLNNMFVMQPKSMSLPAELNAQIVTAMYEYLPGGSDVQPMAAWLAVMEKAHVNLSILDSNLCISHLPRCFATCMKCMLSERQEVQFATARTLKTLLTECLAPCAERLNVMIQTTPKGQPTPIDKLFKSLEGGLSYQYHAAWGLVLQVLATFFDLLGKSCRSITKNCIRSLADLRDSHDFAFTGELDHAVGMAVKAMGPKFVLSIIPLQITGNNDDYNFPRSWLLPVMRDKIQETELSFFTEYFLPLAARLRLKAVEYAKENRIVESKTYDALQQQIWALLLGFCNKTVGVVESFPGIAKILGSAITDRPDLRQEVMASVRKLIYQNLDNDTNRRVLARFAKNYLPLLFNIYAGDAESPKDPKKLAVYETIKCYMQIANQELVCTYFDKSLEKLQDPGNQRHPLMDLAMAEMPYVDEKRLKKLFEFVSKNLESTDHRVQKKCYRILEEMCVGKSDACKKFVSSNLVELQKILLKSLSSSGPSSKGPRLKCLVHIIGQLDDVQMDFLTAVVPEAILCTKETGERPRLAAYNLLVELGHAVMRWSPDGEQEALNQYFQLVLAGLAGSVQMISATELALTRIVYEFKDKVDGMLLGCVVDNTCILLESKARQIVNSALGLLKVLLAAFQNTSLAQYLEKIVSSLVHMKDDNKHHFRFRAKEIFVKLIRKFGFEIIHGMVPESHHKLLAHIRKTQERAKRKRKEAAEENSEEESDDEFKSVKPKAESINDLLRDTDSEEEAEEKDVKSKKMNIKKRSAWLKEDGNDIVDFLDPSVAKKVLATKPADQTIKKVAVQHGFKTAPDGRFIIKTEDDENEQKKGKNVGAEIDDIAELLDALGGPSKKQRKRKLNPDSLDDDDEDETPLKYRAGGSGIHRPIAVPNRNMGQKAPGSEYRSKKAKGDMKKSGKPDPYAYVPLDMKYLNKRKRAKTAGQFKNLVRGAKKGATKGQKMKKRK